MGYIGPKERKYWISQRSAIILTFDVETLLSHLYNPQALLRTTSKYTCTGTCIYVQLDNLYTGMYAQNKNFTETLFILYLPSIFFMKQDI